jgi:hypothetical protein
MTAGINYVIIRVPRTREELITGIYKNRDGTLYISDYTHNKVNQSGAHKCQYGTVIDVGELWYERENTRSMTWQTTNEIQVGDLAVYYFNDDAWNAGRYLLEGEDVYFFIKYQNIYFVIRDEKYIPVNGYVLVSPIYVPQPKLMDYKKEISKTYGVVKHIGAALIESGMTGKLGTMYPDEVTRMNGIEFTGYGLKEGDFVFYPSWCAKPIMFDTQNFVGVFYAMHRFGIHCVIEDVSRVTLKENAKRTNYQENPQMDDKQLEQAQKEWSRIQNERKRKAKTLYY